jgi:4'-phosphopantetheinyl transferase
MEEIKLKCLNLNMPFSEVEFGLEGQGDILLFAIKLETFFANVFYLSSLCTPKELARSRRYLSENDNKRFVITRGLLRVVLAKVLNKNAEDIEIEIGENKKPKLKNSQGIDFNISHTNDCALIAVSKSPIGVDVESTQNNIDYLPIMDTCFSINEKIFVDNHSDSLKAFYMIWTRKESVLKLFGKGIDDDIKSIEVLDGVNSVEASLFNSENANLQVLSIELHEGKMAALACLDSVNLNQIKFSNLNQDVLNGKQIDPIGV